MNRGNNFEAKAAAFFNAKEARPLTVAQVNAELRRIGAKEKFYAGRGYYYFSGGDTTSWRETSIYVYRISQLSLDDVMREYHRMKGDARTKSNPVPASGALVENAARLFKDFTGHEPEVVDIVPVSEMTRPFTRGKNPVVVFGRLLAVEYETVRDGVTERYRHAFRAKSRPYLAASHDGRALYILGGGYTFTDRGIEDR